MCWGDSLYKKKVARAFFYCFTPLCESALKIAGCPLNWQPTETEKWKNFPQNRGRSGERGSTKHVNEHSDLVRSLSDSERSLPPMQRIKQASQPPTINLLHHHHHHRYILSLLRTQHSPAHLMQVINLSSHSFLHTVGSNIEKKEEEEEYLSSRVNAAGR